MTGASRLGVPMAAGVVFGFVMAGCGGGGQGDDGSGTPAPSGSSAGTAAPSNEDSSAGASGMSASTAGTGAFGISGAPSSTPDGNQAEDITPEDITPPPEEVLDMLDPNVDWEALTIIFPTMYSAYDGVHTFQVPAHVDGMTVELSDWQAIPSDAVTFDPDPDVEGGVLITVQAAVEQITIAASAGPVGGTAALFTTAGTPEQWAAGEARYANGVDFELPSFEDIDISMFLDPNYTPPMPPGDLACNNCHTTGAKYFEFQHSPTQAARFSDDDLTLILTMGKKPEGVGFRILPAMLGSKTNEEVYAEFHKWEATEDEVRGLIIYLRSLTPTGQGDIRLPDGTYVAPGETPPNWPMP
jgi:hypothetical protein